MSTLESPELPVGVPARRRPTDRPWSAWWAIPIAIAAVIMSGVVYLIASGIRDALVSTPHHQDGIVGVALHGTPPALTLIATLAQDLTLVGGALLVVASSLKGRLDPSRLGLRPARPFSSAAFVLAGYVLFLIVSAVWTSVMGIQDRENVTIDLGTRDSAFAFVGGAFLVCLVAPVCEELFFRGFLFGALRKHGLIVATLVSGIAFGLAHVASSPIGFIVPLATLGVILALLYERTRSLYPCIALHALNNSIAFGIADGRGWVIPICFAVAMVVLYGLSRLVGAGGPWRTAVTSP